MDNIYIFYLLLFTVAFLYSSVGHGGASGYLALMAIYSISPEVMKPTALMLNLFVSLIAFIQFYRGKHFNWKLFLPLAISSVPMAFVGGFITMEASVYKKILGAVLIIPIIRFLFFSKYEAEEMKKSSLPLSLFIGSIIGFLSGLIGIGGGIILSPVLLLLMWTNQKQTAAISALFIFVNSFSGLAGNFSKGLEFTPDMQMYVLVALAGGLCGSYLGSLRFDQKILKSTLAVVLMMAGWKLLFT